MENEAGYAVFAGEDGIVYVAFRRPRCPFCESMKLETFKSLPNGDGSVTRKTRCRECDKEFRVIAE